MAETAIAITQGTGTNVDAWATTGGNLRQVVTIGDPTTNANVATINSDGTIFVRPEGTVASGVADSGKPVKVGGVYNSSAPIFSSGQRGDLQVDVNGNLKITQATAQSNTIDSIAATLSSDAVMNGLTVLTPAFAAISASTSGNNTIVAAVSGKQIRVLAYRISSSGTVNWKWQSGASGTDITGLSYGTVGLVDHGQFNPVGHFQTLATNTLLNLNLSAGVAVGGYVVYVLF